MKLLYPQFLWALFAILIPIAIHLFNFRKYKTIYFSDVSLLKDVQQQTNKQRQLKHLLVLLLRILFISSLVLAFAQPFIPAKEGAKAQKVGIYLDNSLSMLSYSTKGENFDFSKKLAKDIVQSYPTNTEFRFYTNQLSSRHNLWFSREQIVDEINNLDITLKANSPSNILNKFNTDFKGEDSRLFVISDFQESQFSSINESELERLTFVQTPNVGIDENISVDSVWVHSPISMTGFEQKVYTLISNRGVSQVDDIAVTFEVGQKIVGSSNISLSPSASEIIEYNFTPRKSGSIPAKIQIDGPQHYFDDELYFTLRVSENNRISFLFENQVNQELKQILDDDLTVVNYNNVESIDLKSLEESSLLVLDHLTEMNNNTLIAVENHLKNSKNVLIIPNGSTDINSYNALFDQLNVRSFNMFQEGSFKITEINNEDPYFTSAFRKSPESLDLEGLNKYISNSLTPSSNQFELLKLANGETVASRFQIGEGNLIVLNMGFTSDFGSWYKNDLVLPLVYQSLIFKRRPNQVYEVASSSRFWEVNYSVDGDIPLKVKGKSEFIPRQRVKNGKTFIDIDQSFDQTGFYAVTLANDTIDLIAINADRIESSVKFIDPSELVLNHENWRFIDSGSGNVANRVSEEINSIQYWKQFLLLALFFLLMEVIILRFWKSK